ncbi:MAG TPA: phosphatase PAP2 family protein [Stellaceae bacterium]|nr:phosphatase PAP2 family protein [Stellaceae bacterium]
MHTIWRFVTDFGDTAVTVPLAIVMTGFLVAARQPRLALGWALTVGGCAGAIGALKIVMFACGRPLADAGLSSPSGHTAISIAVYGGFGILIGATQAQPWRDIVIASGLLLALGIAVSRTVLGFHSVVEVVVGFTVGTAALGCIIAIVARYRPQRLPLGWLAASLVIVALWFHGQRWPAEEALHHLAGWFDALRPWCS